MAAFALWPVSLFARMAYSEALLLLVLVMFLFGCQRRWPILVLAAIVGFATACRPVGIALIPSLYVHWWLQAKDAGRLLIWGIPMLPIACWGLAMYSIYLGFEFGDPLAFARTQENWAYQRGSWAERLGGAVILEPVWSKYDPSSPSYWARSEAVGNPLFSLDFANPMFFLIAVALVIYGAWRRELDAVETLLAAGLLAIPYIIHGDRSMMLGQARYALVAFPAFIVLGGILARLPPPMSAVILGISAFFLGIYSALFGAWYRVF